MGGVGNIGVYKLSDTGELEFLEPLNDYPYWHTFLNKLEEEELENAQSIKMP
mgnify:CR=1 FL=1